MEFFAIEFMTKPVWMWLTFLTVVALLLIFDLGVMHRKEHEVEVKESLVFSSFYISIGLLFGGWVWYELGQLKAVEYLTGFIVEKTLSIDNVFVIAMLFSFFHIPRLYQHRVLFWGILGAVVLRGLMIAFGAALVSRFEWVLYVFAAFLIATGVKMLLTGDKPADIGDNVLLRFMKNHFRITEKLHGHDFFVFQPSRIHGKKVWWLTPLFVCLVMIEFADVIFAVDSVPAIFIITTDPYIVFTSNIFAILGLRALYFVLAAIIKRFHYLKYSLSVVLIFIGSKSFVAHFMGLEKFPVGWSLGITFAILASGIGFSLWKTRKGTA
ncbi:MAG: TerC family protein [Alphaproteobacteria bacterium]|nr:TerC family protein [Alphaproteobacteria bacterium]